MASTALEIRTNTTVFRNQKEYSLGLEASGFSIIFKKMMLLYHSDL